MSFDLQPLLSCLKNATSQLDINKCNNLYRANLQLFERLHFDVIAHLVLFLDSKSLTPCYLMS